MANFEKLNSKIASLEAQLAELMQVHSKLAQRLQLPENVINSNNASILDSHINQELEKRLGVKDPGHYIYNSHLSFSKIN